jgi:NADH-quinone oxidoreductase subunit L
MLVAALGWFTAHMFYAVNTELPGKLAKSYAGIRTMLVRKYWVDEFYNTVIVQPWLFLSRYVLGSVVETGVVQGGGLAATGATLGLGGLLRRIQSGNIRSYAGWLALGAAAVLLISFFGFGAGAGMHLIKNW